MLKKYNGPNKDIVSGLATNVRGRLGSTYCLSESGTAGPGASGSNRERTPYACAYLRLLQMAASGGADRYDAGILLLLRSRVKPVL